MMKLTWISEYEAHPGEMLEWRLHPATIATATGLAPDTRPPSYMQAGHIRTAEMLRDVGLTAPTWLGTVFDIAGPLDVAALETTLLQWITRHESLRSGLRLADQQLERFTLDPQAVAVEPTVIGRFLRGEDVVRCLDERFDEACDPLTWPPYLFVTVARHDGFTVYLAFDHSMVDGYSITHIPAEIHEIYAAVLSGGAADLVDAGSYVDFSEIEYNSAEHLHAGDAAVVSWQKFVDANGGGLPDFPLELGVAPGEMPVQVGVCDWLLESEDADAFDAACKAAGGSFMAGVLAVAALVAYEQGGEPVYRTVVPFHTRCEQRWQHSLGWYIGLAPVEIATAEARDFAELLDMAQAAARAAKAIAQVPFGKVCTLLDTVVRPLTVFSYMDGRMLPGADRWGDWRAHAFGKVSVGDEAYVWVNRTVNGLYMTCRYPSTDVAHASMAEYVEQTRSALLAIAREGSCAFVGHLTAQPAHS
jgi:mycolipenoyl-CoA---2-(long-chain-fatty acyl)-trehalose mycolipenoyltransferase / long-chain-acyl-CoA---trehalose acyltransferase